MKNPQKISAITTAEMLSQIDRGCHVYINLPMGDHAFYDSTIISAWKGRENLNHKMIHLRGSPHNNGNSTKYWNGHELADYFSPEQVRRRKVEIDNTNTHLLSEANYAIDKISNARSTGVAAYAQKILTYQPGCSQLSHAIA